MQDASPNSITAFHDLISNEIPKLLPRWSFELKIFKSNTYNDSDASSSQFLYDLSFDNEQGKSITLVDGECIVSSTAIPATLLSNGCSNGNVDSFDHILQTKLPSLWLIRQTLKGENGNAYEIRNGEFVVRGINVFLHGNFKSFVIVVEYQGRKRNGQRAIEQLVTELGFPRAKLCAGQLGQSAEHPADLAVQYVEALC